MATAADLLDFRQYVRDEHGQFAPTGGTGSPEALHDDEHAITAAFNYEDHQTGMTAEVSRISGREGGPQGVTYVSITIRDRDGHEVGQAERAILPAGQRTVRHDGMALEPGMQGQGFATRFNAHAEESYRAHGIEKITTTANIDVGGYSHARAGYDFATPDARRQVAELALARRSRFSDPIKAEIDRVAGNPHSSPIDFAMIGHGQPGQPVDWPGKQIMLGSQWEGVKTL